jgi:hypothetical protein
MSSVTASEHHVICNPSSILKELPDMIHQTGTPQTSQDNQISAINVTSLSQQDVKTEDSSPSACHTPLPVPTPPVESTDGGPEVKRRKTSADDCGLNYTEDAANAITDERLRHIFDEMTAIMHFSDTARDHSKLRALMKETAVNRRLLINSKAIVDEVRR